jgi:putative transposon-encoded protein
MDRHEVYGHEVVNGEAKLSGNGAHVYVPKSWAGATVKVVRTSDPDSDK